MLLLVRSVILLVWRHLARCHSVSWLSSHHYSSYWLLPLVCTLNCLHYIYTLILLASDTLQQLHYVTSYVYKYRRPCLSCHINQSSGLAPRPGAKLVTRAATMLCDGGNNSFTRCELRCYDLKYAANVAAGTGHCKHCSTSFESIYRSSRMVCLLL